MRNLRKFETTSEYNTYMQSGEAVFPNVCYINNTNSTKYNPIPKPLYIEAIGDLTVKFPRDIEYSLDNLTWSQLPSNTETPVIKSGNRVYFRAKDLRIETTYIPGGIGRFTISNKCNIGGNVMSMIYGEDYIGKLSISKEKQFEGLFYNCSQIINAGKLVLPATSTSYRPYRYMFSGCTNMEVAPEIHLYSWHQEAGFYMFKDCKRLIKTPKIRVSAYSSNAFSYMFTGCTGLIEAPMEIYANDSLACAYMFSGCTNLKVAPKILSIWRSSCQGMFKDCTSLEEAPDLPATTLKDDCYKYMFKGCSKLRYVKAMFTTEPSDTYTDGWLDGVSPTGTFVKNASATWNVTGSNGIPEGWTVETATA